MSADNLKDLFIDELKDIYDAEHRLTKALPKLARKASTEELAGAFEKHLTETEGHIARLEEIFQSLDETPKRKTCKAMVGLLEEGQEIMDEEAPPNLKDHLLIAAAQKVEHYEMATYGCLRAWAELLGEQQVVKSLQKTLDEEGAADKKLTAIAHTIEPDVLDEESDESEVDDEAMATAGPGKRSNSSKRGTSRSSR